MAIPKVTLKQIINALKTFDSDYRNSIDWIGWETRKTQKYVIRHDGRRYPPKMIISLATGLPRTGFNGGQQSNIYLAKYDIKVEPISERLGDQNPTVKAVPKRKIKDKEPVTIQVRENYINRLELVREVYKILTGLPRFNYFSETRQLPDNGIYFFFEIGESNADGFDRLVRIGTHRSYGRLKSRIRQHYKGNRKSSVFRRHLGGAIINNECPDEVRLKSWLNKDETAPDGVETRVSEILEKNFYYTCIAVESTEERLALEEGLIALFAGDMPEKASNVWLGNYAASEKIRNSSLWNSEHTEGERLTDKQLARLGELAEFSRVSYGMETGPKALVLIPCCKSKAAVFSEHWSPPLTGLQQARAELQERVCATEVLFDKDCNLSGILNSYAHLTRALDLYVGNFYNAAGTALEQVAAGNTAGVNVLIVSAFYGLVLLNEGIKRYELQMSDSLEDGTKIYRYWQKKGLADVLGDYVANNGITSVWSLLPNSMPSFPYQQVFNSFWKEAKDRGIDCYHVNVPGAGSSSGYQRAKWLNAVMECDPKLFLKGSRMPDKFSSIPGYTFKYLNC